VGVAGAVVRWAGWVSRCFNVAYFWGSIEEGWCCANGEKGRREINNWKNGMNKQSRERRVTQHCTAQHSTGQQRQHSTNIRYSRTILPFTSTAASSYLRHRCVICVVRTHLTTRHLMRWMSVGSGSGRGVERRDRGNVGCGRA